MHGHTLLARALMIVVLFLIGIGIASALATYGLGYVTPLLQNNQGLSRITVADTLVYVTIADTPVLQQKGLSGTASLAPDQGMLFLFDRDDYYQMWMKDMRYSLDIIWISEQGVIVHVEKNISPSTYPNSFTSETSARMVLELPAGFIDRHHVAVGNRVTVY